MSGKVTLEKYGEIKKELNRFPDINYQAIANKFGVSTSTVRRVRKTDDYLGYRQFWKVDYQGRLNNYYQKWADELRFAYRISPVKIVLIIIVAVLAVLYAIWLIGGIFK